MLSKEMLSGIRKEINSGVTNTHSQQGGSWLEASE